MLAEVRSCCGRWVLFVADIAVAMEGDRCRQMLPADIAEPIPADELQNASIGGKPISEMPLDVVQFFRGENWRRESLEWAAAKINQSCGSAVQ